jgi:hypothetical protein
VIHRTAPHRLQRRAAPCQVCSLAGSTVLSANCAHYCIGLLEVSQDGLSCSVDLSVYLTIKLLGLAEEPNAEHENVTKQEERPNWDGPKLFV